MEKDTDQHSAGQWSFRIIGDDGFGYVSDFSGKDILHVGDRNCTPEENIANGHLAKASPLMYRTLEYLLKLAISRGDIETQESISQALLEANPQWKLTITN